MLASISPVGEASRHQRWTVTVAAYLVASTVGGAVVGGLAGLLGVGLVAAIGRPPQVALVGALAVLGLFGVLVDRGVIRWALPSWQRQVDERWLTSYRGWVYGAGFGFQLGAGLFTRIATSATYLMLAAAVATASLPAGLLIGAVFGGVRALPILLTAPLRDPQRLNRFHRRMDDATRLADRATSVAVLATVGVAFVAALATG
ncbi:hypothetical protein FTX61_18885 [Nitriliruptoraceae bacterium ZYF776]|nr:hypothetical protein [Profundirhabdus halotolerans]